MRSTEYALKRFEERLGMVDITFAVTKTTCITFFSYHILLWFAQNTLPLRWQRQRCAIWRSSTRCCDLLKIHYLCGDKDNKRVQTVDGQSVVICSKFITFAVTKTTCNSIKENVISCDLLKIHYLCGDKDNRPTLMTTFIMLWFAQNSLPLRWQRQPPW